MQKYGCFLFGKRENEGAANLGEFFDQFLPQNLVPSYNITPYLRRLNLYPQFPCCTSHSTRISVVSRQVPTTAFESTTVIPLERSSAVTSIAAAAVESVLLKCYFAAIF